jgi:hypothetical protein
LLGPGRGKGKPNICPLIEFFEKIKIRKKNEFYQILIPTIKIIFKNIFSYPEYYRTT